MAVGDRRTPKMAVGGVTGAGREAAGGHAGFVPFGDRVLASRDLPVYSE